MRISEKFETPGFYQMDSKWCFDSSCEFLLQGIYKLCYPAAPVVVVAVGDKDVVFEAGDKRWHGSNIVNEHNSMRWLNFHSGGQS